MSAMNDNLSKPDILRNLYPISAAEAVKWGKGLELEWELKNRFPLGEELISCGKLDHQIGADVKKLFAKCWVCVAVEFLAGDVVVPGFQKLQGFDHGNRGYVVKTYREEFHLVSWREVPEDNPDAISLYVSTPITDPDTPRFRFDSVFLAGGEMGKRIAKQHHTMAIQAREQR